MLTSENKASTYGTTRSLLKTLQQKILQLIKQNQFLKKQNETLITANSENEKIS